MATEMIKAGIPAKSIAIAGDPTVDWMLVVPSVSNDVSLQIIQTTYHWDRQIPVRIQAHPGGAALLHQCVKAALKHQNEASVSGPVLPERALSDPSDDSLTRTYSIWHPVPVQLDRHELVWRMHRFLGVNARSTFEPVNLPEAGSPDCLVVDDANLGFRSSKKSWPQWISDASESVRHVILKMSNPLADGPLWRHLAGGFGDALTVYCSVDDLRKEYASIGQALSWERSATEIVQAVCSRESLRPARRVVVSLGFSGAVIVERDGPPTLVFNPREQEGDWNRQRPGLPVGLGTCITASLAVSVARDLENPDWIGAVQNGLQAARVLHDGRTLDDDHVTGPRFPLEKVGGILARRGPDERFRSVAVSVEEDWQISSVASTDDFRTMASRIVIEGDEAACQDIPVERIGAWSSIDRAEIESMRSVRSIAREYLLQSNPTRPLSLAVFGPPGSGKSFAIKQMTRESGASSQRMAVLEFNLSQLSTEDDLPRAFQSVRDCAVERTLPLVFWDEFDTGLGGRELGWVSKFLAPMQDGFFSDHGINRPIGPAIFIFAGGTHSTMAGFKARAMEIPEAKATDFLSRLRGYLDILGPNPMHETDRSYVLRRALLLRALLNSKAPGVRQHGRIDIDPGVLRAFLDVSNYVHGARSMESIIDMSSLSGKLRYERSSLPPMNQLGLHVDPEEFLALVHQDS